MHIEALYTRAFRNLSEQEIHFSEGINSIIGKTGQGKTSLLEALSLLIVGASFRTHLLKEAISFGQESFFVEASLLASGVARSVGLGYDGSKRHVMINKRSALSTKELIGILLGVSSGLSDIDLLTQAPFLRRRYLDEQIAEIDPYFVEQLGRANRALQQRNALLRIRSMEAIHVWEEMLATSASYVILQRRKTAQELIPLIFFWLGHFPPLAVIQNGLEIRYRTQVPLEEDSVSWLKAQLEAKRSKEMDYKTTLIGHHRDDLLFSYKGISLKQTLSLGQLRLVALAIRLAEWSLLKERAVDEKPIFLLDDLDGTLDSSSQGNIFNILPLLGQVIITSHESICPHASAHFSIEDGLVCKLGSIL
jgi:DNA replication and repair protein RecF